MNNISPFTFLITDAVHHFTIIHSTCHYKKTPLYLLLVYDCIAYHSLICLIGIYIHLVILTVLYCNQIWIINIIVMIYWII